MLAEVSPEQFDEVIVFNRIEPDLSDRIRVILKYGLAALSQGLPVNPEALDPVKPQTVENESPNTHTPQQALASLRMAYGG
jgi:hypothetical protein